MANGAGAVEIKLPDIASGRAARRPVSDFMLRLVAPEGDVRAALHHPDGAAPPRDEGLLIARLHVVSGGRIVGPVEASCGRWVADETICRAACDGGFFRLRRLPGGTGAPELRLLIGGKAGAAEDGERQGFMLNACAAGDNEQILAPAGNHDKVTLQLRAQ